MPVLPPMYVELRATIDDFQSKFGVAESQIERISKKGGSDLDKLAAVGKAAFLGLAGAAGVFGAVAVREAMSQEEANARLDVALRNAGSAMTARSAAMEKAMDASIKLGFADDDAANQLAKLVNATHSSSKATADLALARDVARGRNIDLASATDILTKVETGHVALLGRIGINVKDATGATISQEEALKRLSALYGGQASAYAETFAGKMAVLHAETQELAEKVGFMLIPKLEAMIGFGSHALQWAQDHATATKVLATVIGGPLVAAMGVYIAQQVTSLANSAAQVAVPVAKFFLQVGAAVEGASAEMVLANGNMAALVSTTALGALSVLGPLALVAGAIYLLDKSYQDSDKAAKAAAASGVTFADAYFGSLNGAANQADILQNKITALKAQNDQLIASTRGLGQDSAGAAGERYRAALQQFQENGGAIAELEKKLAALRVEQRAAGEAAKDAGMSIGGETSAADAAAAAADKFQTKLEAFRSTMLGVVTANRSYKDSQSAITAATEQQQAAQQALDALLEKGAVDATKVAAATKTLEQASDSAAKARLAFADAEANLQKVMQGSTPEDKDKAQLALEAAQRGVDRAKLAVNAAQANLDKVTSDPTKTDDDRKAAMLDKVDALANQKQALFAVTDAQAKLDEVLNAGKPGADDYTQALKNSQSAADALNESTEQESAAQDALAQAQAGDATFADQVATAKHNLATAEDAVTKAKDAGTTSALALYDAQQKGNDAIAKGSDLLVAYRANLDSFAKQYPAAAGLVGTLEAAVPVAAVASGASGGSTAPVTINVHPQGLVVGTAQQVADHLAPHIVTALAKENGRGGQVLTRLGGVN